MRSMGDAAGLRARVLGRLSDGGAGKADGQPEGLGDKLDRVLGGRPPGAEAPQHSEDARTLWVEVDEHGDRHNN